MGVQKSVNIFVCHILSLVRLNLWTKYSESKKTDLRKTFSFLEIKPDEVGFHVQFNVLDAR